VTESAFAQIPSPALSGPLLPSVIQGGMGVAISGWELARAVSRTGQLGVVSGTALEIVCARRLQLGDPGGHVRRALAHFPVPRVAEWILAAYFVEGGKPEADLFKAVPRFTLQPADRLQELTVAANFVEVWLAKEGHDGPVGINYLRKIELPLIFACYGAMLAGVDYVLMGAGNPGELPELLRALERQDDVSLSVRVQGSRSTDGDTAVHFSPLGLLGPLPAPRRPQALAIIASLDLAAGLAGSPAACPDGFIIEGPSAGGHNAPPRGPRRTDEAGQPIYDERDAVDPRDVVALGLPVWLAGSYGSPEGLQRARSVGAAGVQVGTAFALCEESGLAPDLKQRVLGQALAGDLEVLSDWRLSPTGFPFRVLQMAGTLSDPETYEARQPVCDLGALRSAFVKEDGSIGYRCPAEPADAYTRIKGGREQNMEGRRCLCNALMASAGLPQTRPNGYVEPPLVTAGSDFSGVVHLAQGWEPGEASYPASAVIDYLLAGPVG